MPSTKGYRSYHGKGGAGRIVLIVLLCLILLAAVGFLVLQRYAVYGSDGSIRFDLPWKQTEEPSGPSAPDGASRTPDAPDDSPDVIIDEPEPPAKPELTELHGAELSESVLRGSADAALTAVPEGAKTRRASCCMTPPCRKPSTSMPSRAAAARMPSLRR